ncbi:DUF4376 domain-containing protein [Bradyrhizobium sp. USDA 313]|uniref:DUF4376 domain-containing protein n=1 Tax=Bradyrhizobium sp. USDA 313 TaxID=3156307 RepID=UPI003519B96F
MMLYDPFNWYWRAEDGRLYSSKVQALVPETDPDYLAWLPEGDTPPNWPRDMEGTQSDAALQAVLDPYLLFVNLEYAAANERWKAETGGVTITGIASAPEGMPIETDDRSKTLVGVQVAAAQADATYATTWAAADGNLYVMTNAEIIAMGSQLALHVDWCFETFAGVIQQVRAHKITTRQQVVEAFKRK